MWGNKHLALSPVVCSSSLNLPPSSLRLSCGSRGTLVPKNTTDQFLQQHISYNFYLQKCLAYQAATALTNSSVPSTLWVVAPDLRWGGGGTQPCLPPASLAVGCQSRPAVPPVPKGLVKAPGPHVVPPGSLVEQVALQGRGQGQGRNVA